MQRWMIIVLAILFISGAIGALGKVFIWGERATNYGAWVPWGLWVSSYIFLVGVAGGAAWTGIYVALLNKSQPNRLTSLSLIAGGVCLAFGLAFIGIDLGKPLRGVNMFLHPTFSSRLAWASWIYPIYFICLAGYFFTNAKKFFMYLAGITAIAFLLAEGLFFGSMVARQMWYTWLTPFSFFTSAFASGSAMVYLVDLVILRDNQTSPSERQLLKKILIVTLIVHVLVEGVHFAFGIFGGAEKAVMLKLMLASWSFWGVFLLLGVALPFIILCNNQINQLWAPSFVLVGMAAYKYSFIRYGFSIEPLPGITGAHQHPRLTQAYYPTSIEWLVAIGFIAGIFLMIQLAANFLLKQKEA
ncbi:NrfD/PsrC family molybdoenzyme membrane anchor subunit [Pelosinus sp. IPA-1]|uniref:NrfD/PsrC family molybdoenzyme membrane anchor subunit n=1 Tax=Pelosinus sp. IPA-1 TaxID=3029569 RepID=UPI00243626C1|nr:NrfD/PsrC family molybdoenzyme membrane anchor subunit [Pelosinus sp. IPA-1]GMB01004.1 polysulfide reductase [Pelosinus sp. IPA-1]